VEQYRTLDTQIHGNFNNERFIARLTLLFGILALVLASAGLYGVTTYTMERRTAEIRVRMALGAERKNVVMMVLRGAMMQTAVGLAVGIPAALLCTRFVKAQLYGVAVSNLGVFLTATCALALAALIAGLIPARRAASINPVQALRTE
jgi:macrolide transport system ATP-binding/permease protein